MAWAVRNACAASRALAGAAPAGHAVVCSTDSPEIAAVARDWGAETPFLRPAPLAADAATSEDVALHAFDWLAQQGRRFAAIAKLQPTSPLAAAEDVVAAVRLFLAAGRPVASVSPARPPSWTFDVGRGQLDEVVPDPPNALRRQDYPEYASVNGAVCVSSPEQLRASRSFTAAAATLASRMPAERGVDVDSESDLQLCAALLAARGVVPARVSGRVLGEAGAPLLIVDAAGGNADPETALAGAALAGAEFLLLPAVCEPLFVRADGTPLHVLSRRLDASQDAVVETSRVSRIAELRQGMGRPVAARVDDAASAAAAVAAGASAIVASLGPALAAVAGGMRSAARALRGGA